MNDIITLFMLLISIYMSNPALADSVFMQEVQSDIRTRGIEASAERLEKDLPAMLAEAGVEQNGIGEVPGVETPVTPAAPPDNPTKETPSVLPDTPSIETPTLPVLPAVDPKKLDYVKELKSLGYYQEDSKDTKLNLRNAILRFQSSNNITVNGKWSKQCLSVLSLQVANKRVLCEDRISSPASEGKWIVVNKTKRILTLYENKKVLAKFPVAIGNPSTLTPDGKYTIVCKVVNPAWGGGGYAKPVKGGIPANPLGYRWLGLSYKGGDELGIHGNNSPYSIGKNISHGCIRMINSDVERLFEIIPRSSKVWIGTEAILKGWNIEQKQSIEKVPADQQQNRQP